ncbi:cyanamide hydratase [Herbiconiux moechotypicola]|uniref:HD domain-containing protein n=1 Tax=Herbiconiux moechotypicola TaxID=637393 RepID=A0ABN3DY94_9MICO|nr:cyanamide hydratase [Herbiconiux moechotypicola]MCS5730860.1 cyanamide hydratase [Herbiconiux moechotypicola]
MTAPLTLADLPFPDTAAARGAYEVAARHHSPAMLGHAVRSWLWAAERGRREGLAVDDELLFVAALLHDVALEPAFDSHTVPFEYAGGELAWAFGAAAGWAPERREHAREVIVRHMGDPVDPADDAESYLLEVATSLDISGRSPEAWPAAFRAEVLGAHPRLGLPGEFLGCLRAQADRKPESSAAAALASGIAGRLAANPLDA